MRCLDIPLVQSRRGGQGETLSNLGGKCALEQSKHAACNGCDVNEDYALDAHRIATHVDACKAKLGAERHVAETNFGGLAHDSGVRSSV